MLYALIFYSDAERTVVDEIFGPFSSEDSALEWAEAHRAGANNLHTLEMYLPF